MSATRTLRPPMQRQESSASSRCSPPGKRRRGSCGRCQRPPIMRPKRRLREEIFRAGHRIGRHSSASFSSGEREAVDRQIDVAGYPFDVSGFKGRCLRNRQESSEGNARVRLPAGFAGIAIDKSRRLPVTVTIGLQFIADWKKQRRAVQKRGLQRDVPRRMSVAISPRGGHTTCHLSPN